MRKDISSRTVGEPLPRGSRAAGSEQGGRGDVKDLHAARRIRVL
jgi:hypothetical protein